MIRVPETRAPAKFYVTYSLWYEYDVIFVDNINVLWAEKILKLHVFLCIFLKHAYTVVNWFSRKLEKIGATRC